MTTARLLLLFFGYGGAGRKLRPQNGDYQQTDELVSWQILNHLVIYQCLENEQIIQIAAIKPN